jgi:hypothetical protein
MLNPDNNLYSVAPVGNVIVIGRQASLKGGLTRDSALNLLTWLILSTNAKPEEIAAGIAAAIKPTTPVKPTVTVLPKIQVPVAGQNVAAFIGEIDPEEQAALDEVAQACAAAEAQQPAAAPAAAPPTDVPMVPSTPTAQPVRTAAPVPFTPARPPTTPVVPPVPKAPGSVDEEELTKTWGVSS